MHYTNWSNKSNGMNYSVCGMVHIKKEGNVLFNDALNTFYLRLYGVKRTIAANRKE